MSELLFLLYCIVNSYNNISRLYNATNDLKTLNWLASL